MGIYDPRANQAGAGQEYSSLEPALAMAKTRAANARFVRIPINWDRVACSTRTLACNQSHRPDNPRDPDDPAYHWTRGPGGGWYSYDAEIEAALDRNLKPVLTVFGAPAYAECNGHGNRLAGVRRNGRVLTGILDCTGEADQGNFRPDAADYADFMTALSGRFPRVEYFQIWNEPNFSVFLKPARQSETIARYRALVNHAYAAIKAEDPGDRVIAGGTAPNPRTGAGIKAFSPKDFLRRLTASRVNFDAYSTHPYTPGGPRTQAPRSSGAVWMGNLGELKQILRRAKRNGAVREDALWVTEFSWDSAPPDCRRGVIRSGGQTYLLRAVPAGLLRRWVSEAAYRMWRQGVSVLIWGQLKDFPVANNAHQGGLYRWGGNEQIGRPKSALTAFRFPFVAYKRNGGAYVWGRIPSAARGNVLIERRVDGKWKRLTSFRTSTAGGLFEKRLRFGVRGVSALRARADGRRSASFEFRSPSVPRGIQPFGCTNISQWQ